jgi:hypothetical protein
MLGNQRTFKRQSKRNQKTIKRQSKNIQKYKQTEKTIKRQSRDNQETMEKPSNSNEKGNATILSLDSFGVLCVFRVCDYESFWVFGVLQVTVGQPPPPSLSNTQWADGLAESCLNA